MIEPIRKNKKVEPSVFEGLIKATNHFYDRLLRALFVGLLFTLDFVMFVYSINGRIIEDGVVNEAMIYIAGGFFAVSLLIILLLSFSGFAQNVFCALFVLLITLIFLNQFALFNIDTFIETWLKAHAGFLSFIGIVPSSWLVGIFLAFIVLFSFRYTSVILVTVIALIGSIGVGVYQTERTVISPEEYVDVKKIAKAESNKQVNNLVYIMAPKFPSYHFLSTIKDVNFRELRDLIIGFYAVNDFEIYPNAFVQKSDTVSNIVDIYNQVNYASTTSGIRGYAEILNDWDFLHNSLDTMALEDNKLYALLSKDGYKISTYSMPQFNLCYKNGQMVSDRCVVKQSRPIKLYDKKSSLEKNIFALLGEWVLSIKSKDLKSVAKMLVDMSHLKGQKILSDNRRLSVEGADRLLDKVYKDFANDGNGVVYMSFVELPSDLYIYDEFCRIKPRKQWVALKDSTLYSGGIDEKRKAYADQAKCLIGMLQMYMEEMYQNDKLPQTDIIIQGVSPLRELAGMPAGQYGIFVADKLVSLGIRRGAKPNFVVNTEVCLASDFTRSLINKEKACYTIKNMKMSTDDAYNLEQNLINNSVVRGSKISNIAANYRDWYEEFREKNPLYQEMLKKRRQAQKETQTENLLLAPVSRDVAKPEIKASQDVGALSKPVIEAQQNAPVLITEQKVEPSVVEAEAPSVAEVAQEVAAEEPSAAEVVQEVAAEEASVAEVVQEVAAEEPSAAEVAQEVAAEEPSAAEVAQEVAAEAPSAAEVAQEVAAEAPSAVEVVQEVAAEAPSVAEVAQEVAAEAPSVAEVTQEVAAEAPSVAEMVQEVVAEAPSVAEVVQEEASSSEQVTEVVEIRPTESVTLGETQELNTEVAPKVENDTDTVVENREISE